MKSYARVSERNWQGGEFVFAKHKTDSLCQTKKNENAARFSVQRVRQMYSKTPHLQPKETFRKAFIKWIISK